jgi:hypothetical protein
MYNTMIFCSNNIVDFWEPKEEGLDRCGFAVCVYICVFLRYNKHDSLSSQHCGRVGAQGGGPGQVGLCVL